MSKVVTEFLADVKEQKIKQLLGIALDKKYWASVVGDEDIEELRSLLSAEQGKLVKNKNGTIHGTDKRDMERINALSVQINNAEKGTEELNKLNEMEKNITTYMGFVQEPGKETMKILEDVAKL